jgi:hypothetical protein
MLAHEVFSLRSDETVRLRSKEPSTGRWIAVQLVSVCLPDGEKAQPAPDGKEAGMPFTVIAAYKNDNGQWAWAPLSHPTKVFLFDLLYSNNAKPHHWVYCEIVDNRTAAMFRVE